MPDIGLKKALIVYLSRPPIAEYFRRAFERAGVEARTFDIQVNNWYDRYVLHFINKQAHNFRLLPKDRLFFTEHPLTQKNYSSTKLLEEIDKFSPDLVFLVTGIRLKDDVLRKIRAKAALFGWWVETEERMEEALAEAALCDYYYFLGRNCLEEARKRGLGNVGLMRHSADTEAFHPIESEKVYDWCFVGKGTAERRAFIEAGLKVSQKAAIYGKNMIPAKVMRSRYPEAVAARNIWGKELLGLYNQSRVVVDISSWGRRGNLREGMNMRMLEVPACRAFLLTDGAKDLGEVLTPGKHVVTYDGKEDFAEKLGYYLANATERERIALEGYKHVISVLTYDVPVAEIIDRFNSGLLPAR